MISRIGLAILAACALPSVAASPGRDGVEAWADSGLDVREGLALWLDASAIHRARDAQGLPPLPSGQALDFWPDASGRGWTVAQRIATARPTLKIADGGRAIVLFDGKDDALSASGPPRSTEPFTLFVVASPNANPGHYSAFFAANARGRNDYTSGFNLDMGSAPGSRLDTLNIEGNGFGGARNLLKEPQPFRRFRTIEVRASDTSVALTLDGRAQGRRDRKPAPIALDEITVGARFYSNEPPPPAIGSPLDGAIAEVLFYDRALSDDEAAKVRAYLAKKHDGLDQAVAAFSDPRLRTLATVADPPAAQMLAPGFRVDEMPIKLPNINNLRYRADGKLVALAYDGDVYLLSDTDGDGLEDRSEKYWDGKGTLRGPIGMCLTPPGYAHGNGVFVASKGKVSLILDHDGDDRGDEEKIVAEGWPELSLQVDALGVAIDKEGSLYFGLGTGDYTNGHQVDKEGKAQYRTDRERGAIVKVSPDFQHREVVASGIRFPVGLAFNAQGDLFATDQEGATWLPNGNPFDELLHIRTGRHYGFPPRHPKHLPNVIDEPSTFDYAPQHQSACGLLFIGANEAGESRFGPKSWIGDAIVCGYSRGKLWRTELVAAGDTYVARNHPLAIFGKLTVDAAIAPDGSLAVAAHSGGPDWGTGPTGEGTLYKVRYVDRERAQPVRAWAEHEREVRVAFDRPIAPEDLAGVADGTSIEAGRYLAPGDRFETLRPGYAVVGVQLAAPRWGVAVKGVSVTPDRRTLVIATEPDHRSLPHALTIPDPRRNAVGGLRQSPEMDLGYDLSGAVATWTDAAGAPVFSGVIPHLDLTLARELTKGSAGHDRLRGSTAGTMRIEGRWNLRDFLRPPVQPGAKVDAPLPPERVVLGLKSADPFSIDIGGKPWEGKAGEAIEIPLGVVRDPLPFRVVLKTGENHPPDFSVWAFTDDDPRHRPIPPNRVLVPWASDEEGSAAEPAAILAPELAGGDWSRGRDLFYSEPAKCSKCHAVRGRGERIGPDLSNLAQRDYASVARDIREPSYAIHPDHVAQAVALKDGRTITGSIREENGRLRIGDTEGNITEVSRDEVEAMSPSPASTMPQGLLEALGPERSRDLLTFLLTPAMEPAPILREGAPPPRSEAEVKAMTKAIPPSDSKTWKPLKILLVAGPKDHGVNEHDYPEWRARWSKLLPMAEGVTVRTAELWPSPEEFRWADAAVFFSSNEGWTAERGPALDGFLARGGGLVYLHWAVNGHGDPESLAKRIGLASRPNATKWRHGPITLKIQGDHPITAGIKAPKFEDESYWEMVGDPSGITPLATAEEDGREWPMIWAREQGEGRVVGCILGHYAWTFDDPIYRGMILRAIAWTAHRPVDRLRGLETIGARLTVGGQGNEKGLRGAP